MFFLEPALIHLGRTAGGHRGGGRDTHDCGPDTTGESRKESGHPVHVKLQTTRPGLSHVRGGQSRCCPGERCQHQRRPGLGLGTQRCCPMPLTNASLREAPHFTICANRSSFAARPINRPSCKQEQLAPRNRSYSLNAFMGPVTHPAVRRNRDVLKPMETLNQLTAPGPSAVFLLVDEHENSIDDAQFLPFDDFHRYGNQEWLNCPSGRHNNAAGFAFADGHAEIHKWQDSAVTAVQLGPPPKPRCFSPARRARGLRLVDQSPCCVQVSPNGTPSRARPSGPPMELLLA